MQASERTVAGQNCSAALDGVPTAARAAVTAP